MANLQASSSSGLTSAKLVPGKLAPKTYVEGRLHILWKGLGDGPRPRLYFALKVRLPVQDDYVAGDALAPYQLRIKIHSDNGDRLAADHVALGQAHLSKHTIKVDLGGALITSVETDGKHKIANIECEAPRRVRLNGVSRILGEEPQPSRTGWFHTPSPAREKPPNHFAVPVEGNALPRSQSMPMKPLPYQLGTLNFSSDPPAPALKRTASANGDGPSKRQRVQQYGDEMRAPPATLPETTERKAPASRAANPALNLASARSAAPSGAIDTSHSRFLPTPSTVTSSRPETIETPPSSSLPASGVASGINTTIDMTREEEQEPVPVPERISRLETHERQDGGSAGGASAERQQTGRGTEPAPKPSYASAAQQESQARQIHAGTDAARQRRAEAVQAAQAREQRTSATEADGGGAPRSQRSSLVNASATSANVDLAARRRALEAMKLQEIEVERAAKKKEEEEAAAGISFLSSEFMCMVGGQRIKYKPLARLCVGETANVMGVVVSKINAYMTRGPHKDFLTTVIIADPSVHIHDSGNDDTNVAIYRKTANATDGFQIGSAVLFRDLKMNQWNGRPKGNAYSNSRNEWVILNGQQVVHGNPADSRWPPHPLTDPERQRLMALQAWWNARHGPPPQFSSGAASSSAVVASQPPRGKSRRLDEVRDGLFFDLTVKVLQVIRNNSNYGSSDRPVFELYVADGTVSESRTRNFHHVEANGIPPSAIFCAAIFDNGSLGKGEEFKEGNILRFPNMRCTRRDGLELKWSEMMTQEQVNKGWKGKVVTRVRSDDPAAIEIEKRIKELQAQTRSGNVPAAVPTEPAPADAFFEPPPVPMLDVAKHVSTTHTDPVKHPVLPLAAVLADNTANQRIRTHAKVARVIGRGAKGSQPHDLAVLWCSKCKQPFPGTHCQSCDDKTLARAQAVYQMVMQLEAGGDQACKVYVVLSGAEAEAILPPLPMVHGGPNEVARARRQISELTRRVEDTLLGNRMDGERTHPVIDWTLESFYDGPPGKLVKAWRVFGMRKG